MEVKKYLERINRERKKMERGLKKRK